MGRIAYVNGRFAPHREASVHIEDRGYQLADGVYEVCAVKEGRLLDAEGHFARLDRSLAELSIAAPASHGALKLVMAELLRRNRIKDGMIYLQITRGVAPRDHAFPAGVQPSLVMTAKSIDYAKAEERAREGIKVISLPDLRWGRCDIKTVGLLPNVLAKEAARLAGAYEAWLVDEEGFVTEGASSNAWIVTDGGVLITRELGPQILGGITRRTVMDVARAHQMRVEERPFTLDEAKAAKEAFISSAGNLVMPVVEIDQTSVGDGRPGEIVRRLRAEYLSKALS
jgi:D-alanine transaminase